MAVCNQEMEDFIAPFYPLTCGEGKYQSVFIHMQHLSEGKVCPVFPYIQLFIACVVAVDVHIACLYLLLK